MVSELEELFTSTARVQILRLFLLNPGSRFYQREIERETGQPIRAVQREVERLEGIGLLERMAEGNRVFYRLYPEFPLLSELTALFRRASGVTREQRKLAGISSLPPDPAFVRQPFEWMETLPIPTLPPGLRRVQAEVEWDRAY
jgi:DNA-binding transcriptional ArsR family regulator